MATSLLLARIIGPMMVVIYGSLFLNKNYYCRRLFQDVIHQSFAMFFSGFIALLLGLIIIQVHNIWVLDWPVLITVLGWIITIQGVIRLAFPEKVQALAIQMLEKCSCFIISAASVMFLIGLFLTYMGYFTGFKL